MAVSAPAALAAIDVHCHVYNARDLPIPGFVSQVVLYTWPRMGQRLARAVIWLVSQIMNLGAISAQDELREIQHGTPPSSTDALSDQELAATLVRMIAARLASRDLDDVRAVQLMDARIEHELSRLGMSMPSMHDRKQIVDDALRLVAGMSTITRRSLVMTSDIPSFRGILIMGSLMTLRRRVLLQRLSNLPAQYAAEVGLFTPALIDLSFWVQDKQVTPLKEQIEVMSAIAAIKGRGYAMHPYVSFCPWRQLVEPAQLHLVKDAVTNQGFIGVKIYPVMGFLPIGNAKASDKKTYPKELRKIRNWAQRLDDALTELYSWSAACDVPIIAHCSDSQRPSAAAGKRAAPQNWKPVLDQRPLRLNLAHCGGLWDLALPQHNNWTETLIGMLAHAGYPNLYTDISDYESVMHRDARDESRDRIVMGAVSRFLDADASGTARKKLMYGTDWVMLSREADVSTYYPSMRKRVPTSLGIDQAGFVGANAARFLGIAATGGTMPASRQRLESFYSRNGLDNKLLQRWDS